MSRELSIADSLRVFSGVQMEISEDPWRHVVWDPNKRVMVNKNELLVRNLLLQLGGQPLSPENFDLEVEYKKAVGDAQTSFRP